MGQVLQARRRPGARAAGGGRRGAADRDAGGHDQQGVRVLDPRDRDRRRDDPRRRLEFIVTGGMESMTNAPYLLKKARFGYRLGDGELIDLDGLRRADVDLRRAAHGRAGLEASRASSASRARSRTRGRIRSHERAVGAQDAGRFDDEIVPVGDVTADESIAPRHDAREARGAEAGVRSRRDDDRRQRARRERRRLVRRRRLGGVREAARARGARDDPRAGRTSPTTSRTSRGRRRAPARIALEKAGKSIGDVKRVEINEAFSSVALNSTRMLGADEENVNVNGGAVALGHPIGASGGRIVGDDGARAAPQRRRARPRRDLLRRRPGRRAADRGLTTSGAAGARIGRAGAKRDWCRASASSSARTSVRAASAGRLRYEAAPLDSDQRARAYGGWALPKGRSGDGEVVHDEARASASVEVRPRASRLRSRVTARSTRDKPERSSADEVADRR